MGDVGDELGAQLLVGDRLGLVGQEDQGLAGVADLVGLDDRVVGAAPVREQADLEALARQVVEGRLDPARQAVLAEGLEHRHPGDEEREALERDAVRLHQSALAVDPQGDEGEVLQHLAPAPLGHGELGLGPAGLAPRAGGVGAGTLAEPTPARARQNDDGDRQQDQCDDHGASVADVHGAARPGRLGVAARDNRLPAMRRAVPLALAALVAAPAAALAQGPVQALPPPKPPAILEVAPGIGYQRQVQGNGQVVHVVRSAPSPRIALAPALAAGSPVQRGPLTGAVSAGLDQGVVAGMNGDFFSYDDQLPDRRAADRRRPRPRARGEPPGTRAPAQRPARRGHAGAPGAVPGDRSRPASGGSRSAPSAASTGRRCAAARRSSTRRPSAPTTPAGGSRYEVSVRLDQPGPLTPNVPRTGTVVAAAQGGGMAIAPGTVVLTGVGCVRAAAGGRVPPRPAGRPDPRPPRPARRAPSTPSAAAPRS